MRLNQLTRNALLGFTAVFLLALATRAADVDKYLPDDSQYVVSINLRQIIDSQLFKRFAAKPAEEQLKNNRPVMNLLHMLGLNPLTDLAQITIAGPEPKNLGAIPTSAQAEDLHRDLLVVVHGDFNPMVLEQAARGFAENNPEKLKIEKNSGTPTYAFTEESKPTTYVALLGKHVVVISGARERVLDAVAKHNGTRQTKVRPELRDLVRQINAKQSVWGAALASDRLKAQLKGGKPQAGMFQQIDAISGGLTISSVFELSVDAHMADAEAAKQLANTLGFAVPIAAGVVSNQPQAKDFAPLIRQIARALHFTSDKNVVSMRLKIDKELIDKIADAAKNPPEYREKPAKKADDGE